MGTSGWGVPVETSQSKWKEVSIFLTEGQASWSWAISLKFISGAEVVGSRAGRSDKGSDTVIGAKEANEAGGTKSSEGADEANGAGIREQGLDRASSTGLSAQGTWKIILVNSHMTLLTGADQGGKVLNRECVSGLWSVIKVGTLEFPIKSRVLFLRQRKFSWEESLRRPTSKGLLLKDYSNVSEGSINSKGNWGLRNRVNLRWQCKEKYLALDESTVQSLRPNKSLAWALKSIS